MRNSSALYLLISTFNPPISAAPSLFYWHHNDGGVWSDSRLFGGMRFVFITFTINLTFINLINFWGNFTLLINCTLESLALLWKLAIDSHRCHFHNSDLSPRQFILFINCTLDFTIYLGPNTGITARSFSHKSRFICHFRISVLLKGIVFQ